MNKLVKRKEENQISLWERIKNLYRAWLLKMAAENRKRFGQSRPDCCDLLNKKKGA